jgi:hypothetical protein
VYDDAHHERGNEQVEQHAGLDQKRHRLQEQQPEDEDAVFQDQVAEHLRDRLAPRDHDQESGGGEVVYQDVTGKVCKPAPAKEEVTKVVYESKEEWYCLPKCSCPLHAGKHGCCDPCGVLSMSDLRKAEMSSRPCEEVRDALTRPHSTWSASFPTSNSKVACSGCNFRSTTDPRIRATRLVVAPDRVTQA